MSEDIFSPKNYKIGGIIKAADVCRRCFKKNPKLERAKALGFRVDEPVYRGTRRFKKI